MVLNQRGSLFWGSKYCKNGVTLPGRGSNFEKEIIFQGEGTEVIIHTVDSRYNKVAGTRHITLLNQDFVIKGAKNKNKKEKNIRIQAIWIFQICSL